MDAFVYFIFAAEMSFVTFELLINSSDMEVYVIISKHTHTFTYTDLFCNVNDSWTVTKYFDTIDIILVHRSNKILICLRTREKEREKKREST